MSEALRQSPSTTLPIASTLGAASLVVPRVSGVPYVPALDGLRAIAIVGVVGYHAGLFPGGYLGVDVFFVLSGFLITSILLKEHETRGTIALGRFWARRVLRLFPELCVLVGILWTYATLFQSGHKAAASYSDGIIALLYFGNWVQAFTPDRLGVLGHTWSLAIEEQFYVVWPFALWALLSARVPRRRVLVIALGAAALSTLLRFGLYWWEWPLARLYYASDTRADGLLLGCALAIALSGAPAPRIVHRHLAVVCGSVLCVALLLMPFSAWSLAAGPLTVVYLATAGLIVHVLGNSQHWLTRALAASPMAWLGRISYGLYLWHFPAIILCRYKVGLPWFAQVIAGLVLSLGLAAVSYYAVGLPCLGAKRRFKVSR